MAALNVENRTLFHGDNLDFLREMNSGTVHLIATDPPFNKGRDFHATPDSLAAGARFQDRWTWQDDAHQEWQDAIQDDYPAAWAVIDWARMTYGDDMGAFLCFMGVRLMEMRRILRDDGSIYLHCDPTASHYLKNLMDAIFGRRNFRNEIVWAYSGGGQSKRDFPRKHDIILRYSKGTQWTFNYDNVRVPYDSNYEATVFASPDSRAPGKTYRPHPLGKIVEDWWRNIPRPYGYESTGYPTQKPLALYERIIKASSNPGDIVLDPFCGCATTCVAAERLDRQWVGMDIWEGAYEQVIRRLENEGLAGPDNTARRILTFGDITYTDTPPKRDDDGEAAAPYREIRRRRQREEWERLSRKEMVDILVRAQSDQRGVACGGCGRVLEKEFMELDHITPRAGNGSNDITNRILLCSPCNRRKKENLTLPGLVNDNKRTGWMRDESRARIAQSHARDAATRVRDEMR